MDWSMMLTIISIIIAFGGMVISLYFSLKKERNNINQKENEHIRFMQKIDDSIGRIDSGVRDLKTQIGGMDNTINEINSTLARHDQKIKHLEKEVFQHK